MKEHLSLAAIVAIACSCAGARAQCPDPTLRGAQEVLPWEFGEPYLSAVADVDKDGLPDLLIERLVLEGINESSVVVLRGTGGGAFEVAQSLEYSQGPTLADLNADGFPDLIVGATSWPPRLLVNFNDGSGHFGTPVEYATTPDHAWVSWTAAADFDGDGLADVFYMLTNGQMCTRRNLGNGALGPHVDTPVPYGYALPVLLDLTGDGRPEAAVPTVDGIEIWSDDGSGAFQGQTTVATGPFYNLTVADLNGDGHPDLATHRAINNFTQGRFDTWLNNGAGVFTAAPPLVTPLEHSWNGQYVDLDRDGDLDIVAQGDLDGFVYVYMNSGGANFLPGAAFPAAVTQFVRGTDFDGDGHADIVCHGPYAQPGGENVWAVSVLCGRGDGTFNAPRIHPVGPQGLFVSRLGVLDVTADGLIDAVISTALFSSGAVHLSLGRCPCPADFNGDGHADSQDFFDFLAAFFNSDPAADVNGDGAVNSQDFFDFLAAFFAGCP